MKRFAFAVVCISIGCKNDASQAAPVTSASASAIASTSASVAPVSSGPQSYAGSYTATIGTLYVPDAAAWDGVKFRGDDGGVGALGEGSITITNDTDAGTISGEIEGPLGPASLTGIVQEKSATFHVAPRSATDLSFSGTGTATIEADKIKGEMHMSSWRANVLRDATFEAKRK